MTDDILGPRLRGILDRAKWDWDKKKIEDAIRHGEATPEIVADHIIKFESLNPRGWDDTAKARGRNR